MTTYEIRDPDEARRVLAQGLWLQRVLAPAAATVREALKWALEVVAGGQTLPPPGFVADVGHAAFGADWEARSGREAAAVPGLPPGLARTYEDHVLGKFYADWTFGRAGDVLRRLPADDAGRSRPRALAYVLGQFAARSEHAGLELSPAVLKGLLELPPQEVLALGWQSLERDGLHPVLESLHASLLDGCRRTAEVLAPEDVFELEHGTALAEFGERVALRQVLQAAARLEATLPHQRVRPRAGRQEVPTRVLDEDTYPVGGFSSLSTRGSIESLLHSQLAYMERGGERPDLFDVKFLRDELLYYARDENQFLRRRRAFVVALDPDLIATRVKDPDLPYQRGVLLLALFVVLVRKLSEWLSTDALTFEFLFLAAKEGEPLARERGLLQMIFREPIENGTVRLTSGFDGGALVRHCAARARRSLVHGLIVSTGGRALAAPDTVVTRLVLDGPLPALGAADEDPVYCEGEEPFDVWAETLQELLGRWV